MRANRTSWAGRRPKRYGFINNIDIKWELFEEGDSGYLDDAEQGVFDLYESMRYVKHDKDTDKVE